MAMLSFNGKYYVLFRVWVPELGQGGKEGEVPACTEDRQLRGGGRGEVCWINRILKNSHPFPHTNT
jgi:hypothetical protein